MNDSAVTKKSVFHNIVTVEMANVIFSKYYNNLFAKRLLQYLYSVHPTSIYSASNVIFDSNIGPEIRSLS